MRSRSLIKRSSKSELTRLIIWKMFGQKGMRLFRKKPLSKMPDISQTTAVFICGLHRSGTSVLHRILRDHPDIESFSDTGVPEDEGQHLQTVFPAAQRLGGPGQFAFDPSAHLIETDAEKLGGKQSLLLREWGAYIDFNESFFLEKSPPNIIRTRFLQSIFPNSKFIILTRHPIPVAMATSEKWNIDLEKCIEHWAYAHNVFLQDQAHLEHCKIVSYEQLCNASHQYLTDIAEFLNIEIGEELEPIQNLNSEYFTRWHALSDTQQASIAAVLDGECKQTLIALRYDNWHDFEAYSEKAN